MGRAGEIGLENRKVNGFFTRLPPLFNKECSMKHFIRSKRLLTWTKTIEDKEKCFPQISMKNVQVSP